MSEAQLNTTEEKVEPIDVDTALIDTIRDKRNNFIAKLEKDAPIYDDVKFAKVYLSALKDSDSQAQTNKRLKTEDAIATSEAEQAVALTEISTTIARNSLNPARGIFNPFEITPEEAAQRKLETPVVKESGKFVIHETELNKDHTNLDYDQFMQKNLGKGEG